MLLALSPGPSSPRGGEGPGNEANMLCACSTKAQKECTCTTITAAAVTRLVCVLVVP